METDSTLIGGLIDALNGPKVGNGGRCHPVSETTT